MTKEFDPLNIGEMLREERREREHEKKTSAPFVEPEEPAPPELAEEQTETEAEVKRIRKKIRRSAVERVVGSASPETKKRLLEQAEELFDDQAFKDLEGQEREKTPEELQIISFANEATNELRRRYGLDDFDIPEKNIHIVKEDDWDRKKIVAFYSTEGQAVAMKETDVKMSFLRRVIHEMIHFKSYNAWQAAADIPPRAERYRVGLAMRGIKRKMAYFWNLNEAVTEELTKRVFKSMADNPFFKKEAEATKKAIGRRTRIALEGGAVIPADDITYMGAEAGVAGRAKNFFGGRKIVRAFTYSRERGILNLLIDKLFEENKDKFKDREEVFEIFAKGAMTGNIMGLGRLIEKTFGKGTLRMLGELGNDIESQEEFVDSL